MPLPPAIRHRLLQDAEAAIAWFDQSKDHAGADFPMAAGESGGGLVLGEGWDLALARLRAALASWWDDPHDLALQAQLQRLLPEHALRLERSRKAAFDRLIELEAFLTHMLDAGDAMNPDIDLSIPFPDDVPPGPSVALRL